jgi:hypothetical protein
VSDLFERLGECPRGGEPERLGEILSRVFAAIMDAAAPTGEDRRQPARTGAGPGARGLGEGSTMGNPHDPQRLVPGVSIARIVAAVAPAIELLAALTPDERAAVHREVEALIERRHLGGSER